MWQNLTDKEVEGAVGEMGRADTVMSRTFNELDERSKSRGLSEELRSARATKDVGPQLNSCLCQRRLGLSCRAQREISTSLFLICFLTFIFFVCLCVSSTCMYSGHVFV